MDKIPVSVLITTKNEEVNIARCLKALQEFEQIIVIDSHSSDKTCDIARLSGADVVSYKWDGKYPKKRQWCLDTIDICHDWVFWVDADEVVTHALVQEIREIFTSEPTEAGFFVKGRYVWAGAPLLYGLQNNKLALMDRKKLEFPVIDDLDIEGMGEIEGHYQPVRKAVGGKIGQINAALLHYAYEDEEGWLRRHVRYASWESEMIKRDGFPRDPLFGREILKNHIRTSMFRPYITFLYSYIVKFGFLDGVKGYYFARSRLKYGQLIRKHL